MKSKKLKKALKKADQKVGELTRKVEFLQDTDNRRKNWLYEAKRAAGYDQNVSFDVVWEAALKALQNAK